MGLPGYWAFSSAWRSSATLACSSARTSLMASIWARSASSIDWNRPATSSSPALSAASTASGRAVLVSCVSLASAACRLSTVDPIDSVDIVSVPVDISIMSMADMAWRCSLLARARNRVAAFNCPSSSARSANHAYREAAADFSNRIWRRFDSD